MSLYPGRALRLGRFWYEEMETALDRYSLEDAREALKQLQAALAEVGEYVNGTER